MAFGEALQRCDLIASQAPVALRLLRSLRSGLSPRSDTAPVDVCKQRHVMPDWEVGRRDRAARHPVFRAQGCTDMLAGMSRLCRSLVAE